ncbi:MAG: TonB-dependent receptor [Candidatus Marinimicrobia bacterium]|nr:TonB-dependent receptor [Candidatus Neomarinimicrobiota bacterium]
MIKIFKRVHFFCLFAFVFCQTGIPATGKVVNIRTGIGIVGVDLIIINSNIGTVTDTAGFFNLEWTGHYPIRIQASHIGYETRTIVVLKPRNIWIGLNPAVLKGEEVIVVGDRSYSEKEVSSGEESINLTEVNIQGIRDVSEAIDKMSSVVISTTETGHQTISVRGANANEVAVFLDGVKINSPLDGVADLSYIDINTLNNVEIIKGGNSVLSGSGHFGGTVHLSSHPPDKNTIYILRNIGISDDRDQDLSGALNLRAGALGFAGQFSGKSRLFDGRTLYTTLFTTLAALVDIPDGKISARFLSLSNSLKYPTGFVNTADSLSLNQFKYKGQIFKIKGVEIVYGTRTWHWIDTFFNNIDRNLSEDSRRIQVSKAWLWKQWSGTLQLEQEQLKFAGRNKIRSLVSIKQWKDNIDLQSVDEAWAGVLRYTAETNDPKLDVIRWELGVRRGNVNYQHSQTVSEFDTALVHSNYYEAELSQQLKSFRLGVFVKGDGKFFEYSLFFNQGWNKRFPTLNDQFLWYTSHNKETILMYDLNEEERDWLFSIRRADELAIEHVSTTEVGWSVLWDKNTIAPINKWELKGNIFRNHFIDKISYRQIGGDLLVPYNTNIASINGMEISMDVTMLGIFSGIMHLNGNAALMNFSNLNVFPNKPQSLAATTMDWRRGMLDINISHIFEGPKMIHKGGLVFFQSENQNNTNMTISLLKKIWKFDIGISYTIRNVFSSKSAIVNYSNWSAVDPFNYYNAHRKLISLKIRYNE